MAESKTYHSLGEDLKRFSLPEVIRTMIKNNLVYFEFAGAMDSHRYRQKLFRLFEEDKMEPDHAFMFFFMFSLVKNVERVLRVLDSLPTYMINMAWHKAVVRFIQDRMVQFTSDIRGEPGKFAAVHVPSCMPPMDMFCAFISQAKTKRNLNMFFDRPTSVQFFLNEAMQERAKAGYRHYWDVTVNKTNNKNSSEAPEFREEYYQTSASDRYILINEDLTEYFPSNPSVGYSEADLQMWIDNLSE